MMSLGKVGDRHGYKFRLKQDSSTLELDLANSKSLLSCLFKAQSLGNQSSQLSGIMHNLLCNLFSSNGTFYLSVCHRIFKMQSESQFICSFIQHPLSAKHGVLGTPW